MNTETKRHIDAARQVLVGVVPNPTSQIDQITNALIYKFMDDMDQSAIKQGGEPSFFVGDLKDYAWTRLIDTRIGNQERMNIYSEALVKFSESKQLPQLFREIFKSAFLPYRSPEVLGLFLKEISYFDYSHPEELGNAYEYLLSIMSSQGDAGQFRTPRHIIDFIVAVVNPGVEDKVLDPACGTGGFLVSAYNHIMAQHDGKNPDGTKNNEKPLTPDQRKNLMGNFEGYDVDPGMVRIAQVNMYLHQFKNPKIVQYDTLSMDERWSDKFSVILANPPFMSPKGGVSTHSKFSIQSTRSEVLFVDYIMNHLRPQGRAGIIVPEGIIFQSGKSHTQLRKNLVEDGLSAVVSLPSGVFNPYAGVKTSILLFDNEVAKKSKEILFVKIENDGFDPGAQRRPIQKNDLPEALEILNKWKDGEKVESKLVAYVEKTKIAETGDYNLSGDRYRVVNDYTNAKWPMVELGEVADFIRGVTFSAKDHALNEEDFILVATTKASQSDGIHFEDLVKVKPYIVKKEETFLRAGDILISVANSANLLGRKTFVKELPNGQKYSFGAFMGLLRPNKDRILPEFLDAFLITDEYKEFCLSRANTTTNISNLSWSDLSKFKIPFPPLEIQEQIVAELDGYQNIIAGAKQIIDNYSPVIKVDPSWQSTELGNLFLETRLGLVKDKSKQSEEFPHPYIKMDSISVYGYLNLKNVIHVEATKEELEKYTLNDGDFIYNTRNAPNLVGKSAVYHGENGKCLFNNNILRIRFKKEADSDFINYYLNTPDGKNKLKALVSGTTSVAAIYQKNFATITIPLPPIEIQKEIVGRITQEQKCIDSALQTIRLFEGKVKETTDSFL